MNKRGGFTLIELLAVIVILAIIAVIAVPIVLNIIDDSKNNATLRSAEMYLDATEMAIANRVMHHRAIDNGAYPIMSNGDICLGVYNTEGETETCAGKPIDPNNDKVLKVEVKGEKPTSGTIYIEKGQIFKGIDTNKKTTLVISEKRIEPIQEDGEVKFGIVDSKNSKEEVAEVGKMSICKPLNVQTEGSYTPGDKYECDVDPNKEGYDYMFYVLNATTKEVNLIMDSNITRTGEAIKEAKPTDRGLVAWITQTDYEREDVGGTKWSSWEDNNAFGPITAIEYLQDATSSWTNAKTQTISTFTDEAGESHDMAITYTTNARLPYYSEVSNVTKETLYLIDYLDTDNDTLIPVVGRNEVDNVYGYWTLTSRTVRSGFSNFAWVVRFDGTVFDNHVGSSIIGGSDGGGVRPVINLKL